MTANLQDFTKTRGKTPQDPPTFFGIFSSALAAFHPVFRVSKLKPGVFRWAADLFGTQTINYIN